MVRNEAHSKNGYGIASLVLGIAGLLAPFLGIVMSVLAIVFSRIQKKRYPNGIATAGFVLGIIGVVFGLLIALLYMTILAFYFRPASLVTNSAAVTPPFYITDTSIFGDNIRLGIKNDGGEILNDIVANLELSSPGDLECSFDQVESMAAGQSDVIIFKCPGINSGDQIRGDILVEYQRAGSDLRLVSSGTISGVSG